MISRPQQRQPKHLQSARTLETKAAPDTKRLQEKWNLKKHPVQIDRRNIGIESSTRDKATAGTVESKAAPGTTRPVA